MQTIGDLLARDLRQKIEEIIKVDQTDEQSVYTEITEYMATERIRQQYRDLLKAIAEAPAEPHEGIGVWVSGFFGSGKSSFAKNLGYVLANRTVLGHRAGDLFKAQVHDPRISELVDYIHARIPTEVIMFDVTVDRAVKRATERLAEVMYTVLLRELDYAEDYDVAELEIELEKEGKLEEFIARCRQTYSLEWRTVRKGAQKISRASAILHAMDPATYPTPDAWAQSLQGKSADITVGKFVERTFELCARRRPGKGLVFIIDEVGQYVARSADKIEDLRAVVEQFGKVSKNLLTARKAIAPVWIVVTSQEKLDEVVAAIDSKRVELAKLQDLFQYRIDMAPADIREVATRRVLAKKADAVPILQRLFREAQGQLNAACHLERTTRHSQITEDKFIQFYPYLPHFIELSIDIMSGIRLQPGAPRHLGGSNRTIIKQTYEMLVSERTALAAKPVGTLATLDKIFELVEGNLSTERQKDISDITQRFKDDPEDRGMAARVAKTICLLEFVRDLPRTEANIAACLVDAVGRPAPLVEVQQALKKLEAAQFVRNTEDGWKLQTAQEKHWDTERRALEPRPKDRHDIVREVLQDIFGDPKLRVYRFRDLRNFRVGISVDGIRVGEEGQVPLSIVVAEDAEALAEKVAEVRDESRQEAHKHDIYWVFALTADIDELIANLYASREMVKKYEQIRAQNRITTDEAACLANEKNEVITLQKRLRDKMIEAMEEGQGLFRGVAKDAAGLGKTMADMLKKLFDAAVPDLYPKLELGARPLKGTEAEEMLKAANLSGLSQVFYGGEGGLNLVTKEGAQFVPNLTADIAKEVLDYLNREHAYGNKDTRTGRALEMHFGGLGYGWDRDVLRLVLAVLFRAGAIDVSSGGQRFDSSQDPRSRVPFTNNTAFRSALFTPAKPIDLKTLTQAVTGYEQLTGDTVDVERNAIAAAIRKVAEEELKVLLPVEAQARAYGLPVIARIEEYRGTLESLLNGTAEDCVRILAGEGKSLREARDRLRRIREATAEQTLVALRAAKRAASGQWPVVRGQRPDLAEAADRLQKNLEAEDFYDRLGPMTVDTKAIAAAYGKLYMELHAQRTHTYLAAIEDIKGRAEWTNIPKEQQAPLLDALHSRACEQDLSATDDWPLRRDACDACQASVAQMASDLAAVNGHKAQVMARLQELTAPKEKVTRVRLVEFFADPIASEETIEKAIERLREHLLKLLAEGTRIIVE